MNSALLTIDDIASKNTPAIVDYLNEKRIKAILFATGQNVERYYEEALYAVKNGMIVGNHSYSHPAFSSLSMKECMEEIEKCEIVLERLYKDSGVERVFRPFRFPYGNKGGDNKNALQKYLKEKGFQKVDDTHITYPWWRENSLDTDIDTFWTFDFEEYKIIIPFFFVFYCLKDNRWMPVADKWYRMLRKREKRVCFIKFMGENLVYIK